MSINRALMGMSRAAARFLLAVRYWLRLGYSWHLAWLKAERR